MRNSARNVCLLAFILLSCPGDLHGGTIGAPTRIVPDDFASGDYFGTSVAAEENTVAVGALRANPSPSKDGAIYIYERKQTGSLRLSTKITPESSGTFGFGEGLAIDGDRIVVGAPIDGPDGLGSGRAFVYERNPNVAQEWSFATELQASGATRKDSFGGAVAIDGSTILVGASDDSTLGNDEGTAYIFELGTDGEWRETARLFGNAGRSQGFFGWSVALNGDTAIVGAIKDDTQNVDAGAAYVFERDATNGWKQTALLAPEHLETADYFGSAVAIQGDTAFVSAYYDDTSSAYEGGAVYVYRRSAEGEWQEAAQLVPDDLTHRSHFGVSIDIAENQVLIGAYKENSLGRQAGAAYLFREDATGQWRQVNRLTADDVSTKDWFGYAVALTENAAYVGSVFNDLPGSGVDTGSVYAYSLVPEPGALATLLVMLGASNASTTRQRKVAFWLE